MGRRRRPLEPEGPSDVPDNHTPSEGVLRHNKGPSDTGPQSIGTDPGEHDPGLDRGRDEPTGDPGIDIEIGQARIEPDRGSRFMGGYRERNRRRDFRDDIRQMRERENFRRGSERALEDTRRDAADQEQFERRNAEAYRRALRR
jgi:hypothetical protein